jgi:hypothetical protein
MPADWDLPDASALQAVSEGRATPEQQKRALDWIMYKAAGMDDLDYRTDPREHAFVSGRRFVGLQIRKMLVINVGALAKTRS